MSPGALRVILAAILCGINLYSCVANLTVDKLSSCPNVNFTCTLVGFPSATLRWFFNGEVISTYPYQLGDSYPRTVDSLSEVDGVEIQILSASLSSNQQLASFHSSLAVNILTLQEAGISSVGCGDFGRVTTHNVSSFIDNDLQAPMNIAVQPEYNTDSKNITILVQWNEVHSSNEFCIYQVDYTIELRGASPNTVVLFHTDSSSCKDSNCSYILSVISLSETYSVSVFANNSVLGTSARANFNGIIYGSINTLFDQSLVYEDCTTTAYCFTTLSERGNCTVQYSEDFASCQNLSAPVRGLLNSSLSLELMKSLTSYCIWFTFYLNSEPIVLMTNFTTSNGGDQFSSAHLAMAIIGMILCLMSPIPVVIFGFLQRDKRIIFVSAVTVPTVLTIVLWIVTIIVTATQENTCDPDWQQSRTILVIFTFSLSCGVLILSVTLALMSIVYIQQQKENRREENERIEFESFDDPSDEHNSHPSSMNKDMLSKPQKFENDTIDKNKWVPDGTYNVCQVCKIIKFSIRQSYHHCRSCGRLVCDSCSSKTASFKNKSKPQRVCDVCYSHCVRSMGGVRMEDSEQKRYNKKFMMMVFRLDQLLIFDPEFEVTAGLGKESLNTSDCKIIQGSDIKKVRRATRPVILMCLEIITTSGSYIISASTRKERDQWIQSISTLIGDEYPYISTDEEKQKVIHCAELRLEKITKWKERFVILTDYSLLLYESIDDEQPSETLYLVDPSSKGAHMFICDNCTFDAGNTKDRDYWINEIIELSNHGNMHANISNQEISSFTSRDRLETEKSSSDNFYHATSHRKPKPVPRLNYSELASIASPCDQSDIEVAKENYAATSFNRKGASINKSQHICERVNYSALEVYNARENYDVVDRSTTKKITTESPDLSSYSHFTAPTQQYASTNHKKRKQKSQIPKNTSGALYSHLMASSASK